MTPFSQFRLWWHRASSSSRAVSVLTAILVTALFGWIAVPSDGNSSGPRSVAAGAGASRSGAGASSQPVGGSTASSGPASGTGQASTPGGAAPADTTDTPGETTPLAAACTGSPVDITVGVVLIDVAGLNSTFGVPSPDEQQGQWSAVIDSVNQSGQAGCTNIVADYQTFNNFNTSQAHAICLHFAEAGVFAVLNGFLPLATDDCVMENHIPLFEIQPISRGDVEKFYPYYFSVHSELQVVYRNFAYATQQLGVWSAENGFKRLGIFYRDCQPDVNEALMTYLAEVGVPAEKVSRFNLGCPANFASPADIQQGIIQFKTAGVTTLTIDNDIGDVQNITKQSQIQDFHPRWVIPDGGIVGATGSVQFQPDTDNFDNALAITPDQYGAVASGAPLSAGTDACDQAMTAHGQKKVLDISSGYAGVVCNTTWMFAAAVKNAPALAPDQLAAGLQAAGSVEYSYPFGPNSFSAPGVTFAGQFWRPVTFHKACACWHVDDPEFKPPF